MMNPFLEPFPKSVRIDGTEYPIVTDFREWIRFSAMLKDADLTENEKIVLIMNYVKNVKSVSTQLIDSVFAFYRADGLELKKEKRGRENQNHDIKKPPLFDWCMDAPFVMGDFRRYYQIDLLRIQYLHWWEFRCLFQALPDDSNCMKRISYRGADLSKIKNKDERKRIAKIQREIAIPYLTEEEEEYQLGEMFW